MVFKRRDARHWAEVVLRWFYPRGGWGRAVQYMRHRLHRLPGTPESIARGVFAGAVTVFTPFYGLHFVVAALLARVMKGNILAALLATFIGNPLTYVPIAVIALETGYFMLGVEREGGIGGGIFRRFSAAWRDLRDNFMTLFNGREPHWDGLRDFYFEIFWPWTVGGIIPGLICGLVCYYLSVPMIRAYQKRRISKLRSRMEKLKAQAREAGEAETQDAKD